MKGNIDKNSLQERLVSEFNYPPIQVALVADKLMEMTPFIIKSFVSWWETGEVVDCDVEGYTVERLQKEHGMNIVASYLTLDWLSREPQRAIDSLRKGHDNPLD